MNSYSFIIGSLILLPVLVSSERPVFAFDYSGIFQVAYLSVFVTGLAYLTYFMGLSITGASSGSLIFFVKPALASIIAVLFLKESASLNLIFGTILVIVGIVIVVYYVNIKEKISQKCRNLFSDGE